jgi:fatty-acyl-CoA synthase
MLFVDPTLLPALAPLRGKLPTLEKMIVMTSDRAMPAELRGTLQSYESFIAGHPASYEWPELDERTASALCYTSGTTGNPKGVLYSHRSTVLHAYAGCLPDVLCLSGNDAVLAVVPMFHANAWGLPYNALITGFKLVFAGPKIGDPAVLADLIESEGVTMRRRCRPSGHVAELPRPDGPQAADAQAHTGRRIRGAAQEDPGLRGQARRDRAAGLGLTEMSPLGTVGTIKPSLASLPKRELQKSFARSRVALLFGVRMKVVDEQNHELQWDGQSTGELKVRGPWICKEYFKLPRCDAHDDDGWFATGDIASIDPNGYLTSRTERRT